MKNVIIFAMLLCSIGCSKSKNKESVSKPIVETSTINIDGSSTVFLISEAVAEEFQKKNTSVKVTVASSGTGGGFKKFCNKEIAIAGASRPIKPAEVKSCKDNSVEYIELPVAYDGIAIIANPGNTWLKSITVDELKGIWRPEAQETVKTWSHVRDGFPNKEIHLFGAGTDSGTYDYFTKAIVGEEHKSRGDFTSSEDDNILVQGIASDKLALGFVGFAYYFENKDKLKLIAVNNGTSDVYPSHITIEDGSYQPLSRPLFIYVRRDEVNRKEVQGFVHYYLQASKLVKEVGYVELPKSVYEKAAKRFDERVLGSVFLGEGSKVGIKL